MTVGDHPVIRDLLRRSCISLSVDRVEIADDHVHLFVQTDPKHSPANIARQFKSYSDKHLLEQYPEIRKSYFWGGGLWKVEYYVGTTGAVSEEVVERYLEGTEH